MTDPAPTSDAALDPVEAAKRQAVRDAKAAAKAAKQARTAARAVALQLLYAYESNRYADDGHLLVRDVDAPVDVQVESFARELLAGYAQHRTPIDAAIDKRLTNWTLARLAVVDRNILRLGAYEVLYRQDVPPRVAINEAVELAKQFGSDDKTSKLVNGVLDNLARDHRPESMRERREPTARG